MSKGVNNSDPVRVVEAVDLTSPHSLSFVPVGAHNSTLDYATVQTLSDYRPAGATKLLLQTFDQNIRIKLSGANPTASDGFQIRAGDPWIIIQVGADTVVKAIEELASAKLNFQWGV